MAAPRVKFFRSELQRDINRGEKKGLRKAGQVVSRKAKQVCPVGMELRFVAQRGKNAGKQWTGRIPGTLKKSIRYRITRSGKKVQIIAGKRSSFYLTAFYAMWTDRGTKKMYGRKYMSTALESSRPEIMMAFNEAMGGE